MMKETPELKEELAACMHVSWSGWVEYMFRKCTKNEEGALVIPVWAVERWTRQMYTHYEMLSEEEKESDRVEAEKILALIFGRDT